MRVALFEDDPRYRESLAQVLALAPGFELAGAWPTATAGIAAAAADWDLVVMDLDLPDLSGIEATRRLKAEGDTAGIPIIGLSAHAMVGDREKALAAGCDDYDTKPGELPRLLGKVESFLSPD